MFDETAEFLRTLYKNADPAAFVSLWQLPTKSSLHLPLSLGVDEIARRAHEIDDACNDVYFGVALRTADLGEWNRGKKSELHSVTALFVDIDLQAPPGVHKASNEKLPANEEEAIELFVDLPYPPNILIHSGYGLHAYFLLDMPFDLTNKQRLKDFETFNGDLQEIIRAAADRRGWHLDVTKDATRVLRLPGTNNKKLVRA